MKSKKSTSHDPVRRAVRRVRRKLKHRHGLLDLSKSPRSKPARSELEGAPGFVVRIPGIGRAAVVKPETLVRWLKGKISLNRLIAELDYRGKLIRGADGNLTRQVQIAGTRQRYYCFALGFSADALPERSAPADGDDDEIAQRRDAREALRAARSREMPFRTRSTRPRFPSVRTRPRLPQMIDDDIEDWGSGKDERGIAAISSPGRPVQLLDELISKKS